MNAGQLAEYLTSQGIELWTDAEQLYYRGPQRIVTPTVLGQVKRNKAEIVRVLTEGQYVSKAFPLSYPQRSLWYIHKSAPESAAYNTALCVRLYFSVNIQLLQDALQILMIRHPSLRTIFTMQDGGKKHGLEQKILAYQKVYWETRDASAWSPDELRERVKEDHERPFDLEKGPVLRASLYTRSEKDHVLLISIPHIVCDGWSMWTLLDEQWKIYFANETRMAGSADGRNADKGECYPEEIPSLIAHINTPDTSAGGANDVRTGAAPALQAQGGGEFRAFIQQLLLNAFQRMGVFRNEKETYRRDEIKRHLHILPGYARLFDAMLDILAAAEFIAISDIDIITCRYSLPETMTPAEMQQSLHEKKERLIASYPELEAYVKLVWTCTDALPAVLSGAKSYLEVLFPNGSLELVEKTYKGNSIADFFNARIAEIVKTYIEKRLQHEASATIRILEIGAGTGGASQSVLKAIKEYGDRNQVRYCYSDVSIAFLRYGENTFGKDYPFVEFKLLDIESNPTEPEWKSNSFDIVVACNVIHATRRVESTLRHIKRLLKKNGLMLIHEITEMQSFLTLTFGLTDGWWRFEDDENRLNGSPLIGPAQWKIVLERSGFRGVRTFGHAAVKGGEHDASGQSVITAESDGIIRNINVSPTPPDAGLVKLTHTYEDFVRWQSEFPDSTEGERQWHYWKNQLAGELPVLDLPLDRPRPALQTYNGRWIPFRLNKDLSMQLQRLAGDNAATLYTVLLAAYHILLHRYTGQDEILVGCPTTGRPLEAFNGVVGHFVNTVVVRTDLSGDPTAIEFMDTIRRTVLDALDHQYFPFSLLVERLNPKRDASRTPVFQTMFVFQKPQTDTGSVDEMTDFYSGEGRLQISGRDFESFPLPQQEGQFDLSIEMTGSETSLKGVLKYNRDLFDEDSMRMMSNHYLALLQDMVQNPGRHASELELMRADDIRKALAAWNCTDHDEDFRCVQELFEEQVKRSPDEAAVVYGNDRLSYRELNERANQVAHYLADLGVRPDEPVGLCMERSLDMIIGILGILKAGGAYVPLDIHYPMERLHYMLEDSQLSMVLVTDGLEGLFQSMKVRTVRMGKDRDLIEKKSGADIRRNSSPDQLAYILYTSGSTGKPKGVAMPHKPLWNLIQWQKRHSAVFEKAKTVQFTTINFDVSFQEIFSTLGSGGTLVLIQEEMRQDPAALLQLMRAESVERIFTPFVFLQMLAEAADADDALIPSSLREIITAGEQLRITPAIAGFMRKIPHCVLCNQYGPTEAHVVTSYTLTGDPASWPYLPPIGKPIANTRIHILDKHLKPVPPGIVGEVYIGGRCLARGYHRKPELTRDKFISSAFDGREERLYRTGDMARYLPDGNIVYLGRADHQVKIRGYRIELAEIERQMLEHEAVSDAVVVGREDKNGMKSLCAYYVSEKGLSGADIKGYLSGKLPDYMVPSAFVKMESIPLLPNKKVDRNALPRPDLRMMAGTEYVAPRDEVEENLVKLCREVLDLNKIGINDNLFDLGVNSLTTLTIQRKIDVLYPGKIRIPDLIHYSTIAGLAGAIKSNKATAKERSKKEEQFHIFLDTISQEQKTTAAQKRAQD